MLRVRLVTLLELRGSRFSQIEDRQLHLEVLRLIYCKDFLKYVEPFLSYKVPKCTGYMEIGHDG